MRKLARICQIKNVLKHPNADTLDIVQVDGWRVVAKTGLYKENDLAVYLEIDSFVPTELAPYLTKVGKEPKLYEGVRGEVLKTIRLRGELSQGLLIPLSETPLKDTDIIIGNDVTEQLNIRKYEKPLPASLAGDIRCHFPSVVPKTDAERIQNLSTELEFWKETKQEFYVTEKLDGTSFTCMRLDRDIHVCSRNYSLKETEKNTYWLMYRKYNLENVLKSTSYNVAIQGEIVGNGIQENQYRLSNQELFVFSVYNIDQSRYLSYTEMVDFCKLNNLSTVPYIDTVCLENSDTADSLLLRAEGKTLVGSSSAEREGLVWRNTSNPFINFKTISNTWLLKN
jgi:RNA ligase (TIGR02306 family)